MDRIPTAFVISAADNVATALSPLACGPVALLGDTTVSSIEATCEIPQGHKIALRNISAGENVLKYGIPIGRATADIPAGSWVHLHVMQSNYDERSSHLDLQTGAPKDTKYE